MHLSAQRSAITFFEDYPIPTNAAVIELGSASINDSLREHLPQFPDWTGVDLEAGPGVDVVLTDPYQLPFNSGTFDVAVATSVFEHNEMFWVSFLELVRVVRNGGYVYLCSPSNGHIHRYPLDCYRFYPDAGFALQNWARRNGYAVTLVESFVLRKDESEWNDWVAIFEVGRNEEGTPLEPILVHKLATASIGRGTAGFEPLLTEATEDQLDLHHALERIAELERELSSSARSTQSGWISRWRSRRGEV